MSTPNPTRVPAQLSSSGHEQPSASTFPPSPPLPTAAAQDDLEDRGVRTVIVEGYSEERSLRVERDESLLGSLHRSWHSFVYTLAVLFCFRNQKEHSEHEERQKADGLSKDKRRILLSTKSMFPSNRIVTSKYTVYNFLPKNLFEQFRRLANFYFLCVAAIQLIPDIAPVSPVTSILPLAFVISVTAIKQAYEDYKRHQADEETNTRLVLVLRRGIVIQLMFEQIQVGDIVKVTNGSEFPCDLVLISSSDPDGHCYITTANLDGETNLKVRTSPPATRHLADFDALKGLVATLDCAAPTADLYKFKGRMFTGVILPPLSPDASADGGHPQHHHLVHHEHHHLHHGELRHDPSQSVINASNSLGHSLSRDAADSSQAVPLSISNLLQKGARLKNTECVFGIAVYTGADSKMVLNQQTAKHKFSSLEKQMNWFLIIFFIALFVLCLVSTVLCYVWEADMHAYVWYLGNLDYPDDSSAKSLFVRYAGQFLTFLVLYNYCIPISLYVTVELQKFYGAFLISWDDKMKDKVNLSDSEPSPAKANTSDLNEELGMIQYVFSDKTGTLTENVMKFVGCSVAGKRYKATSNGLVEDGGEEADGASSSSSSSSSSSILPKASARPKGSVSSSKPPAQESKRSLRKAQDKLSLIDSDLAEQAQRDTEEVGAPHQSEADKKSGSPNHGAAASDSDDDDDDDNSDVHGAYLSASLLTNTSVAASEQANGAIPVFLTALSVCHTVFADRAEHHHHHHQQHQGDQPPQPSSQKPDGLALHYQASSPDEEALVSGAARMGFVFEKRTVDNISVVVHGEKQVFDILHVLEFSSDRKRMSIVVRDAKKQVWVFTKGAESALEPLLSQEGESFLGQLLPSIKPSAVQSRTMEHLGYFATHGLRTLLVAARKLSNEEYSSIEKELQQASVAMSGREALLARVYEQIEKDLVLLGAVAIEDKLQVGVDVTMSRLRQAGIHVWVLTGDKQETAINISMACGHISPSMRVLYVNAQSKEQCEAILRQYLQEHVASSSSDEPPMSSVKNSNGRLPASSHAATHRRNYGSVPSTSGTQMEQSRSRDSLEPSVYELSHASSGGSRLAIVIDGATLAIALQHHDALLLQLCQRASTVLCCRMSPIQKAHVVRLVKNSPEHPITLAIGDGANDVSMIQEADVGIGIMGKEGRQAACASDYAFAKFRFLQRLLLVHGRYSYIRIADVAQYFFYKNVAFITAEVFFAFFSAFSGQTLYESVLLMFFNIAFTSLPILVHGVLEKDVGERHLLRYPQLYASLRHESRRVSFWTFGLWMLSGLWHTIVVFFGSVLLFGGSEGARSGQADLISHPLNATSELAASSWAAASLPITDIDVFTLGTFMYTVVIFVVTFRLLLESSYVTWVNHLMLWGSIVVYAAFMLVYCAAFIVEPYDMYWTFYYLMSQPLVWAGLLLLTVAALTPDIIFKYARRQLRPLDWHIVQEEELVERQQKRNGKDASGAERQRLL